MSCCCRCCLFWNLIKKWQEFLSLFLWHLCSLLLWCAILWKLSRPIKFDIRLNTYIHLALLFRQHRPFIFWTRPNEFGSMTARKDDSCPMKSIFCHKRPKRPYRTIQDHEKAIQDHEKAIQYHNRLYKTVKGHTRPQ